MDVYFYDRSIHLDQLKCRTGPNYSWKASSSVHWKMVLGVAAVVAARWRMMRFRRMKEKRRSFTKNHYQVSGGKKGWERRVLDCQRRRDFSK